MLATTKFSSDSISVSKKFCSPRGTSESFLVANTARTTNTIMTTQEWKTCAGIRL